MLAAEAAHADAAEESAAKIAEQRDQWEFEAPESLCSFLPSSGRFEAVTCSVHVTLHVHTFALTLQ